MSTNGNDDDEKVATVIQWPGRTAATQDPPATSEPPADATDATDDTMAPPVTLEPLDETSVDAFEAAVRRALYEKLAPEPAGPDVPRFPPRGADDLVAQVYSALSGKDPSVALSEVRDQLAQRVANQEAHEHTADIIDLAAAREARKQAAGETSQKLGGAIKDTFNQFIANMSALNAHRSEVVLDSQFFKEHGPSLLGSLFQGLAAALLKTSAQPPTTAPAPASEAVESPTPEPPSSDEVVSEAPASPVQVNVKVDFASILAGLFRRRPNTPPPEPPSET